MYWYSGSAVPAAPAACRATGWFSKVLLAAQVGLCLTVTCAPARAALSIGGHFALHTLAGEAVTEQNFKGKWQLLYFGFTFCPDACPAVLNQIGAALQELGKAAQIQPIFITVDPQRDSAERLQDFLAHFDSRIVGLRGTQVQTEAAARAYRVYFKVRPVKPGSETYTIDHSSFLFLMKSDGSFAQLLQTDAPSHRLADELRGQLQLK